MECQVYDSNIRHLLPGGINLDPDCQQHISALPKSRTVSKSTGTVELITANIDRADEDFCQDFL